MPHYPTLTDYRLENLLLLFISFLEPKGSVSRTYLHATAEVYEKELAALGIDDLGFYFDIVTDRSKAVDRAVSAALDLSLLGWGDMSRDKFPINAGFRSRFMRLFLAKSEDFCVCDMVAGAKAATAVLKAASSGKIQPRWQTFQT